MKMKSLCLLILANTLPLGFVVFSAHAQSANASSSDPSALWECKGVTIQQSGPASISVGGRLEYDIVIHNGSGCDLNGSTVMDFIPRMSTFHQASPQPTDYPDATLNPVGHTHPVSKIEWKSVSLEAGKDTAFKVSAYVRSPDDRVLLNTACIENSLTGRICSQFETTVIRSME
jgi:hypothetical protein